MARRRNWGRISEAAKLRQSLKIRICRAINISRRKCLELESVKTPPFLGKNVVASICPGHEADILFAHYCREFFKEKCLDKSNQLAILMPILNKRDKEESKYEHRHSRTASAFFIFVIF